jgi:hypothetical protein
MTTQLEDWSHGQYEDVCVREWDRS